MESTDPERTLALGPVRHACHRCGTCCTGWRVRLADIEERERVTRQAAVLGIEEPLVEGALRRVDGRCVFLGADNMCRIHARFGHEKKPLVCRFFPRRALVAGDAVRIGADPGCTSTWKTWRDGPLMDMAPMPRPRSEAFPAELVASEEGLIGLAGAPGMTVALFMGVVVGDRSTLPELPPGLARRLASRLSFVTPHLRDPENGDIARGWLEPMAEVLDRFGADEDGEVALPSWAGRLSEEQEGFALEVLRRTLFLRLGDEVIPPIGQTLLWLGGVLAAAWADPRPERFGPALSAWSRVSRLTDFWAPALPDTDMARWVLSGH